VFPGSFDAAAAEAVAGGYGLTHAAGLPALASLVQASLLAVQHERATTRYRLLQTVRVYARERLREAGEQDGTARRHRDAYLGIAGAVGRNMRGPGLPVWLPRARREHENLQAALHWSLERGDAAEALQLAAHIWWYWFRVGNVAEGRALLERALLAAAPRVRCATWRCSDERSWRMPPEPPTRCPSPGRAWRHATRPAATGHSATRSAWRRAR
jgi:non-specific serine/threonine protein kinase